MKALVINNRITDRSTSSFQQYLKEVQSTTILTAHEEVRYARKSREGDKVARRVLIESNLRFVISVAKQYSSVKINLQDLVNEGNIGLITAANRFDERTGFKFISYAVYWIRRYIFDYINQMRDIKLPLNRTQALSDINKVIVELEQKLEREVTLNDLLGLVESNSDEEDLVNTNMTRELFRIKGLSVTSYNKKIGEGENEEIIDVINGDSRADELVIINDDDMLVGKGLNFLNQKEREVIEHMFGLNGQTEKNLVETGKIYGQSREGIRQIKNKALTKMKGHLTVEH